MAPNTTGHRQTDHLRIVGLIEAAADFAEATLKPGGAFVAKAFQGGETAEVIAALKRAFAEVRTVKPKASRAESSEVYPGGDGVPRAAKVANVSRIAGGPDEAQDRAACAKPAAGRHGSRAGGRRFRQASRRRPGKAQARFQVPH